MTNTKMGAWFVGGKGSSKQALIQTTQLLEQSPIHESFIKGIHYLKNKKLSKAKICFTKASYKVDPFNPHYKRYVTFLGLTQVLSGDSSGLHTCYNAIETEHKDAAILTLIALAELHQNNRLRAIKILEKSLQIDPNNKNIIQIHQQMGQRKSNCVDFLNRKNPINSTLGKIKRETHTMSIYKTLMINLMPLFIDKEQQKKLKVGLFYEKRVKQSRHINNKITN